MPSADKRIVYKNFECVNFINIQNKRILNTHIFNPLRHKSPYKLIKQFYIDGEPKSFLLSIITEKMTLFKLNRYFSLNYPIA